MATTRQQQDAPSVRTDSVSVKRDRVAGPYDRSAILPFTANATGFDYVQRHLLGEPLKSDPPLSADEGASLERYAWEYLTENIFGATMEFAKFYHRLRTRGIKIELV